MMKQTLESNLTALIVVDIQEAFRNVIKDFEQVATRTALAIKGFQLLNVPILITEQYPKGLGKTAFEITEVLTEHAKFAEKTTFSSYGEPNFIKSLEQTKAKQIIICGLETHICVNQTVHDLLNNNYQVHLLNDCITSRYERDREIGLNKMLASGAINSCVEMAFFELMKDAKHQSFKEIQRLIK